MNRKNLSLFTIAVALVVGFAFGFNEIGPQMALAVGLAGLIVPHLPRVSMDTTGFVRAEDPAEQLVELTRQFAATKTALEKKQGDLDGAHKIVMDAIEKGLKLAPDVQAQIDKAIADANGTSQELKELGNSMDELTKTVKEASAPKKDKSIRGQIQRQFDEGGALHGRGEKVMRREQNSMRIVLDRDITSASVSTGMLREPYIDSLVSLERQPLRLIQLLSRVPIQSDSVKWGQQTVRENNARIVAEGTKKPYSNYKWEARNGVVHTIAHLTKMTLQALADAPRLAAEIEDEMRFGWELAREDRIINGQGGENDFDGLIKNATPWAIPVGMNSANVLTGIDRLRVAQLQIHLAYAVPDGHVLNPINLAEFELMRRDPDNGGGYIFGNPDENTGVTRLWRLPVVETPSIEVGEFLTGAFGYSVRYYDREGIQVLISTENDTDFEDNLATMRVEGRGFVAVRRPYGIVHGNLDGTSPGS